jgi:hypothetical protein
MKRTARSAGLVTVGALVAVGIGIGPSLAVGGNVSPTRTIKGTNTGLTQPIGVVRDGAGRAYLSDFGADSVGLFGAHATGDVAPSLLLKGNLTGIDGPEGVALDKHGFLYVANVVSKQVSEFAPGASGNVAPANSFTTGAGNFGLALDNAGDIYVSDATAQVRVYDSAATGSPAPIRTITGGNTGLNNPLGINIDVLGRLWVANGAGNAITAYAAGANGDVAPVRTIKGSDTQLNDPTWVTTDDAGNIYVGNHNSNVVTAYSRTSNGNVAPTQRIAGVATGLSAPWGISVDKAHTVLVANSNGPSMTQYSRLFPKVTKPSKVRALAVHGGKAALTRNVTWNAPASTGNGVVISYRLVVAKGSTTLLTQTVPGNQHSFILHRAQLRNGTDKVTMKARTAAGFGPAVTRLFPVKK